MQKRKDGRYSSQVYVGMKPRVGKDGAPVLDDEGNPVMMRDYITIYGATQREVREKSEQLRIKRGRGVDIASANDSFGSWADRFLKAKESQGVSVSCLIGTRTWRRHLVPLDDTPISKVSAPQLQAVIDTLADYHDEKPPLAKRTLVGIKQTAWQIFHMAAASRVIEYNPAEYVYVPRNATENHREAISEEQQRWVREVAVEGQIAAMVMLYAGLRRGELLALTWGDIDLVSGTISVTKAAEFIGGIPQVKRPKTEAGIRTVRIPSLLADYLKEEKGKSDTLYLVTGRSGNIPKLTAWRNYWKRYMLNLNMALAYKPEEIPPGTKARDLEMRIETFTPHQLRHTFATILYKAGVDTLTARDQMGHSDIKTTLGIYTHLDKKYKKTSMSKLDDFLCKSNASQNDENNTNEREKAKGL